MVTLPGGRPVVSTASTDSDHGNSEFWLRSLSFEPLGGAVMLNAGFDLVHYYELAKTQHLAHAGASLGW
ncbi:MAG TPA: hypothetical protein VHO25_10895 [Polyangiaceae bacterium]|nr:hypothetical protein [Polyangiaceae bacterium]